jgi:hypothetical protein
MVEVLPLHQHLSPVRLYEPDEMLEEHTLPCSTEPNHGQNFTTHDVQAQALEHLLAAETFIEPTDLNEWHLSHHSSTEFRK